MQDKGTYSRLGPYVKELETGGMVAKDVVDGDETALRVLRAGAVCPSVIAGDLGAKGLVLALVVPVGFGRGGVAAGVDKRHCCDLDFRLRKVGRWNSLKEKTNGVLLSSFSGGKIRSGIDWLRMIVVKVRWGFDHFPLQNTSRCRGIFPCMAVSMAMVIA